MVQNIANELEFGEKEAYMGPMNPLVQDEIPRMKRFLGTIAVRCPLYPYHPLLAFLIVVPSV